MASAETTETFACTPEEFYQILTDYEKYSEFLSEVKRVKVEGQKGDKKVVAFDVSVVKTFSYKLLMSESPGKRISWTFDSGDMFKTSTGSWDLSPTTVNGKPGCQAKYAVEATFKVFVPSMIAKALVNVNLPNMMRAYQNRVKTIYGK